MSWEHIYNWCVTKINVFECVFFCVNEILKGDFFHHLSLTLLKIRKMFGIKNIFLDGGPIVISSPILLLNVAIFVLEC